jgi:hypothetical protein
VKNRSATASRTPGMSSRFSTAVAERLAVML